MRHAILDFVTTRAGEPGASARCGRISTAKGDHGYNVPTNSGHLAFQLALILSICLPATGCSTVCRNVFRTVVCEPAKFCWRLDSRRSVDLYEEWAEEAWRQESQACAAAVEYPEYAFGFQEGFVDYVYAGGNGEPPPVPPRKLWNVRFRSMDGKERVNQWFEGYRQGARAAQDGGYRAFGVIQSSAVAYEDYTHEVIIPSLLENGEGNHLDGPHQPLEILPEPNNLPIDLPADHPDGQSSPATRPNHNDSLKLSTEILPHPSRVAAMDETNLMATEPAIAILPPGSATRFSTTQLRHNSPLTLESPLTNPAFQANISTRDATVRRTVRRPLPSDNRGAILQPPRVLLPVSYDESPSGNVSGQITTPIPRSSPLMRRRVNTE